MLSVLSPVLWPFQAFARNTIGDAEMPSAETEIGATLRDAKASALSDVVYEKVKETKVDGFEASAEQISAAITVQAAFRRRAVMKAKRAKKAAEGAAAAAAAAREQAAAEKAARAAAKKAGGGKKPQSKR